MEEAFLRLIEQFKAKAKEARASAGTVRHDYRHRARSFAASDNATASAYDNCAAMVQAELDKWRSSQGTPV